MAFKILAMQRMQASKIAASTQEDAGKILEMLTKILGKPKQVSKTNKDDAKLYGLERVEWKTPEYVADFSLDKSGELGFALEYRAKGASALLIEVYAKTPKQFNSMLAQEIKNTLKEFEADLADLQGKIKENERRLRIIEMFK